MNPSPIVSRLGLAAVAVSTALLLVALPVAPYLSSGWVAFEQGRAAHQLGGALHGGWRGVRFGAIGLVAGTAIAGIIALVAFDAAFEVFHRLFFAQGTYRFDPATSRLVQLFPEAFWSETAVAVGAMILLLREAIQPTSPPKLSKELYP